MKAVPAVDDVLQQGISIPLSGYSDPDTIEIHYRRRDPLRLLNETMKPRLDEKRY